jgi:hypothetical protein
MSRREVLAQIDYIGGFLSVAGMILFMMGMQWGGYQYKWSSAHVLAPLILGVAFLVAFVLWEAYGAKHPMFPKRLRQEPRILGLTLVITFISGANFFSILMFWPTQAFNVYGHDPVGVGVRGIPVGFSILAGACIVLWLLSLLRGHNKELLIASSILMTAGCGALAIGRVDNLYQLWGLLVVAGLGIGGIVVPASIICKFHVTSVDEWFANFFSHHHLPRRSHRNNRSFDSCHPRHWWFDRILRLLQRLHL